MCRGAPVERVARMGWRRQCGDTSLSTPALLAAARTIRNACIRLSGPPVGETNTGASSPRMAVKASHVPELAQNAQRLFAKQDAREKRRLLNFLVSNCSWRDGELIVTLRQPFDLIAETTAIDSERKAAREVSNGLSELWGG